MNKITQKPELNVEYINLNKAETDSFRHEMIMKTSQYFNKEISSSKINLDPILEENPEQKSIFIRKQALQKTISVYQWRHKTCYPAVKPIKIVVKSFTGKAHEKKTMCKKNSQSPFEIWNLDDNIFQLLVTTEKINHRLIELGSLSLPQLFYLLKQILVGFECLIDIFGIFEPTEEMVAVNEQNEWRFWISQDFASNSKKESNITEAEFILKIIKMVETRLPHSKVGTKFFEDLKNLPVRSLTFLNLLDMTNIFISFNRIMVAKKFVSPNAKQNSSLYGSKNQSYFKLNKTYTNDPKQTPKNLNDKTLANNPHQISYFEHTYPVKQNGNLQKLSTMKSLNEKSFNKKEYSSLLSGKQNEGKKEKQSKSHLKISQFYCAETLSKNNVEKRASFLFNSTPSIKEHPRQMEPAKQNDSHKKPLNMKITAILSDESKSPAKHKTNSFYQSQCQIDNTNKIRPFSPGNRSRKFSFQNPLLNKPQTPKHHPPHNNPSPQLPLPIHKKQRKNSYYVLQKPPNKQNFSQSPNKSNRKIIFQEANEKQHNISKNDHKNYARHQNILMNEEPISRNRKYSEHVPRIKSLDEFAKRNKKMTQSSTLEANDGNSKQIRYGNLKSKDIACHTRHATISGMAFGQVPKKFDNGFNNINNDLYNGRFQEIMKSIKSRSNGDKNQANEQMGDTTPRHPKRRVTLFQKVRQCHQRQVQLSPKPQPFTKPQIRISNTNNQTAQTLNRSSLLAKNSQQSNSMSNNNNNTRSGIRDEDDHVIDNNYLTTKKYLSTNYNVRNHKGMISESNISDVSCKTYQPKEKFSTIDQDRIKHMATSQDCFNNHHNKSDSSQEFLKSLQSNNWNKKISGLFSDVASIKMLKQSSHFGEELELFEKDYLKNVKLEKLDKFGKQLKGSIIEHDFQEHLLPHPAPRHNKSFSLIGEVKQEPCENDPSYLQYSTSMICQSRHPDYVLPSSGGNTNRLEVPQVQRQVKNCESFEQPQKINPNEEFNGGFNFSTELYKIVNNQ